MLAYTVSQELVTSVLGFLFIGIVYIFIQFASIRERIAKIEEWIRQQERRRNGKE